MLKTEKGLTPLYNSGYENYQKLKLGWEGEVQFTQKRNYKFHKKLFALCNLAYENQDKFINFEHYRGYLICKAGFYTAIKTDKGTFVIPDSISFANMDEIEFSELYSKVLDVVIKEIGITSEQIEKEIINFM